MDKQTFRIDSGTIIRAILFVVLAYLLYELLNIFLAVLAAVVIASALEPAIQFFTKKSIPRLPSVIGIYLFGILGIFTVIYFFVPPILQDLINVIAQAPDYVRSLQLESSFIDADGSLSVSELIANLRNFGFDNTEDVISFVSSFFGGLISFILVITLSFYLAVRRGGVEQFIRLITPVDHEEYVADLWHRSQKKIGQWMQGQFILMVIVGVLTYIGLTILGVPNALLLGILAGLFEIIPIFGPIMAAVPAIGLAAAFGGISLALLVAGWFIIVQQFESNLLHPLVVTKVVGVPPIIVILAVLIGGSLAGFLGVLLAVPLAAAFLEFAHDVDKAKHPKRSNQSKQAAEKNN